MRKLVIFSFWLGQMTERPKVHDWKSCVPPKGTVGSNPTLSAIFYLTPYDRGFFLCLLMCLRSLPIGNRVYSQRLI